jgi:hypothetical protein
LKKEIDNELNHFLGNIYYQISKVGYDNHNLHEHMNFIRAKKELSNVLTLERLDEKLNEFYKKAIQ